MKKLPFRPRQMTYSVYDGVSQVAAAIIGSAVVGGVVSASASKSAADTQANAANNASNASLQATQQTNALQYQMYQQQLQNISPQMQVQQEALSALASGFGLGTPNTGANQMYGNPTPGTAVGGTITDPGNGVQPGIQPSMAGSAVMGRMTASGPMGGLLSATGGGPSGGGYPTASPGSAVAAPNSAQGEGTYIPGIGQVKPVNAGASQGQLDASGKAFAPGSLLANFTNKDLNSQLSPSYDFIMNQGLTSTANYDAAHGISGGQAVRDQTGFAANTASTFYQQAFNNYLTQQQTNISNLSALAGNGATGVANAAAGGAASGIASNTQAGVANSNNFLTQGANAQAAGTIGAANALTGAIGSATSGYLTNKYLNG